MKKISFLLLIMMILLLLGKISKAQKVGLSYGKSPIASGAQISYNSQSWGFTVADYKIRIDKHWKGFTFNGGIFKNVPFGGVSYYKFWGDKIKISSLSWIGLGLSKTKKMRMAGIHSNLFFLYQNFGLSFKKWKIFSSAMKIADKNFEFYFEIKRSLKIKKFKITPQITIPYNNIGKVEKYMFKMSLSTSIKRFTN